MPKKPPAYRPVRQRPDVVRPSAHARGYTRDWQKASKQFLDAHPLCVRCRAKGRVTGATVVDHITDHKGDQRLFWDEANWQPLCKPHHDHKTLVEGRTPRGRA